jgi:hypothetical protein
MQSEFGFRLGFRCGNSGPTFGAGFDFYTNLSTEASVALGYSYACRVGDPGSAECRNDFAGGYKPNMIEIEVYAGGLVSCQCPRPWWLGLSGAPKFDGTYRHTVPGVRNTWRAIDLVCITVLLPSFT